MAVAANWKRLSRAEKASQLDWSEPAVFSAGMTIYWLDRALEALGLGLLSRVREWLELARESADKCRNHVMAWSAYPYRRAK